MCWYHETDSKKYSQNGVKMAVTGDDLQCTSANMEKYTTYLTKETSRWYGKTTHIT
jgi:hypothetical protein